MIGGKRKSNTSFFQSHQLPTMDYFDETYFDDEVIELAERSKVGEIVKQCKKPKKRKKQKRRSSHSPTRTKKKSLVIDDPTNCLSSSKSWYGQIQTSPSHSSASSRRSSSKLLWATSWFESLFGSKSSARNSYDLIHGIGDRSSLSPKWKSTTQLEENKIRIKLGGSDHGLYNGRDLDRETTGFYISSDEDIERKGNRKRRKIFFAL